MDGYGAENVSALNFFEIYGITNKPLRVRLPEIYSDNFVIFNFRNTDGEDTIAYILINFLLPEK